MKTKVIIMMSLFISLFLTGCEKELVEVPGEVPGNFLRKVSLRTCPTDILK